VIHHAPVIYQERNGIREKVEGECVLLDKDTIGFELADYARTRSVYIDPGVVYSTYLGGSNDDAAQAIAVDKAGSAYLTGFTKSIDFPVTSSAFQSTNNSGNGENNVFVTKISVNGSAAVYSTYLGGSGSACDEGAGIAVDPAGEAYVTGAACSADFPTTAGAFQTSHSGPSGPLVHNGFVIKLSADGTQLIYSTYLAGSKFTLAGDGSGGDGANGIAIDSSGFYTW
jgi:hypothetical protein